MLIGHYAASLLARRAAAEAPLWLLVAGAQLPDILWSALIMTGLERVEAAPALPEGLAFVSHDYSHSLAATAAWAVAAALLARRATGIGWRDSAILGLVVLSHWFLDLVVHRADLPLWPGGGTEWGLGLWRQLHLALGLELLLFLLAGLLLLLLREGRPPIRPLLAFLGFGALFMIATSQAPPPPGLDPLVLGPVALFGHLLFVFLAWLVERSGRRDRDPAGGAATSN